MDLGAKSCYRLAFHCKEDSIQNSLWQRYSNTSAIYPRLRIDGLQEALH